MKRFCIILIVVVCLNIFYACVIFAEENTANGGTITGKILDIKQNPIEGVKVKIVRSGAKSFTVITDTEGNFKCSNIPVGRYTVNYRKAGYGSRTGKSVVVDKGGNHVVQHKMYSTTDVYIQKIEPIVHHVTDNIGMYFDIDNPDVMALRQSLQVSIENVLEYDRSLMSMVLSSRQRSGTETLDALLNHSETKITLAKHLTTQQLKEYIDFTQARKKNSQQACIHFIAALLEQSLSLTVDQRNNIIQMLIENADKKLTLENILNEPFQRTVYLINNNLKLKIFFQHILNQTQREIWQVMVRIYEEDSNEFREVIGIEVLEAPQDKAVEKPEKQNKQLQVKSKEEIQESLLLQLAKTVITAHTEQLGIRNEQALRRLDLAAMGVAHQFTETEDTYINTRVPFVEDFGYIVFELQNSLMTREDVVNKLNTIEQELQEKKTNLQEIVDVSDNIDIQFIHEIMSNMFFDRISNIINHPLYQQAIKDVLPKDAYTQYIKEEADRIAFLQQAARDVVVTQLDIYLLLNANQRKQLEKIAEELSLPIISNVGLIYMMLKLFLSVVTDTWSPWQQHQFVNGG